MKIDAKTVLNVAKLAKIELSAEEIDPLQQNLQAIVDYVGQLDALNLDGIEPTAHPFMSSMRLREDDSRPFPHVDELIASAPEHTDTYFKVPKVLG